MKYQIAAPIDSGAASAVTSTSCFRASLMVAIELRVDGSHKLKARRASEDLDPRIPRLWSFEHTTMAHDTELAEIIAPVAIAL